MTSVLPSTGPARFGAPRTDPTHPGLPPFDEAHPTPGAHGPVSGSTGFRLTASENEPAVSPATFNTPPARTSDDLASAHAVPEHPQTQAHRTATRTSVPSPDDWPAGRQQAGKVTVKELPAQPSLTVPPETPPGRRDLKLLPKAHLHLHFTGAMRPQTMVELAQEQGVRLPPHLLELDPLRVPADARGWFRFQRSYDAARTLVRSEAAMRRIVREAAEDDAAEGSVHLEMQVDPTSYAPWVGGLTPALEIVLDQARISSEQTGVQISIVVAASRIKHPLDARTLARLAAQYVGDGRVVGFGLSNDERVGDTAAFAPAFRIARDAGLASVPHGGELLGPASIRQVVSALHPTRLGHGVRATEDLALLDDLVAAGVAFEVCPTSNIHLGVYPEVSSVPLRVLEDHGATVALAADDPLLFHSRLQAQYAAARDQLGFSDAELAGLARQSIQASLVSEAQRRRWLSAVDQWLANPPELENFS